ncbi:MAG: hypothetical protein K9H64_18210 [Bacteroidales bacterium]|nr:hypothetical protein [Bacteroidales bacterium]MCF8457970.1 hypothetical protein [Bacteroidales bacterium]
MNGDKKLNEKEFIEKMILSEVTRLQEQGFYYLSFFVISQAIEFLGSFLDDKPFRAKQQSQKRFNAAIARLFPAGYGKLNKDSWLYQKLRNHLAHSFLPSSWIVFSSKNENPKAKHLGRQGKKTVFVAEDFLKDFEFACNTLFAKIESGEIKPKKLGSDMVSFGMGV